MGTTAWRRAGLAAGFADAAVRYWLTVFPLVHREASRWRQGATAIPEAALRQAARDASASERANLDGAAAFAAFAPLRRRAPVARAVLAFQAAYDYLDSLAELPSERPEANARALHEALRVAVSPGARHGDYYRHLPGGDDGGYLRALVDTCRGAVATLPGHRVIGPLAARAVARMIDYQALIHAPARKPDALRAWADAQRPPGAPLRWWETAAASASSLPVFALIAAAARPDLPPAQARAIADAYFPWVGALHVLLDSLIDAPEDARDGHHSLIAHYRSPQAAADGLGALAQRSFAAVAKLPDGAHHRLILAAMVALYLSAPAAGLPHAVPARERLLAAVGDLALPTMLVLRARRVTLPRRRCDIVAMSAADGHRAARPRRL